ncbi:hypothetical protein GobsU_17960 [Candidatus Moduliflexus flocculans]|uniref:Uncharacterized protein n=1 Tax=Candidatus Moduliflexus flocculans TaxID=1499966 RepID=A0A0S6VSJ6_9BACT|nr:hypothetical protein GobsU_17960 [Candidatus Moduliflexus flocculans]
MCRLLRMRRCVSIMLIIGLCAVAFLTLYGCRGSESDPRTPVEPGQVTQLSNYWASKASGEQVGMYLNEHGGAFSLQVPAGGPYRLTYTVSADGGLNDMRSYHIVFRALHNAVLCLGLMPNDLLRRAELETGSTTAPALHSDGTIELFAWPYEWVGWDTETVHLTDMRLSEIARTEMLVQDGLLAENVTAIENQCRTMSGFTPVTPKPCPVTTNADNVASPVSGSLRQVLAAPACQTIIFASGVTNIVLAGEQLTVTHDVVIHGSGVTINGNNQSRVFYIDSGVTATLEGMTITGGNANAGWGVISAAGYGGGIYNFGTLTLSGNIVNNRASIDGGGINNQGTLTLIAGQNLIQGNLANLDGDWNGSGGGLTTISGCPAAASYGTNYRCNAGVGACTPPIKATLDNCNATP